MLTTLRIELLYKRILDRANATGASLIRISNEDYRLLVKENKISPMGELRYFHVKVSADPNLKLGDVIPISLILK